MRETFLVDLPPEVNNTAFDIVSYPRELRDVARRVVNGQAEHAAIDHVDIGLSNGRQSLLVRVFPGPYITREFQNKPRLFFISGSGPILTFDSKETDIVLEVGGQFRLYSSGSIRGTLTVWRQEIDDTTLQAVS